MPGLVCVLSGFSYQGCLWVFPVGFLSILHSCCVEMVGVVLWLLLGLWLMSLLLRGLSFYACLLGVQVAASISLLLPMLQEWLGWWSPQLGEGCLISVLPCILCGRFAVALSLVPLLGLCFVGSFLLLIAGMVLVWWSSLWMEAAYLDAFPLHGCRLGPFLLYILSWVLLHWCILYVILLFVWCCWLVCLQICYCRCLLVAGWVVCGAGCCTGVAAPSLACLDWVRPLPAVPATVWAMLLILCMFANFI
jgi:hypothetical protein